MSGSMAQSFEGDGNGKPARRASDKPAKAATREPRAPLTPPEDFDIPISDALRAETGLPDAHIRLRRYGPADAPLALVMGGISAGRTLTGEGGWWNDMVGAGATIDLEQYGALGIDFAPIENARVQLSPHTQAVLIEAALDALGVAQLEAVIGASYGGMVGLAFAARAPTRVKRLCVISAAHRPSPIALGWRGVQRRIVEFALEHGKAGDGLALARQLAMITYRSNAEFSERFDCTLGADGRSDLDDYLIARGTAYVDLMPPQRWLSLSESIDRSLIEPEAISVPTTVVACTSDQIAPLSDMEELAQRLPQLASFHRIESLYGHDAFLKENEALAPILAKVLKA